MDTNQFDYQEFLKKRHARFNTPEELISKTIKKATGQDIAEKNKLIVGETNEVFDIKLRNGKEVILRIFHGTQNKFINEKWAMNEVASHGVPVARILSIDEEKIAENNFILCVMTKIPGLPLSESENFKNRDFAKKIITQTGSIVSKIHEVKTRGFGELLNGGVGEHKSYEEWIKKIINKKSIYIEVAEKNDFEKDKIGRAVDVLVDKINLFSGETAVLCHSDLAPKHVMVNNGKITGIIDFGNCHGGSPVHDFAWWQYWHQNYDEIEWLKAGYLNKTIFDDNFETKFHFLKILISLELLHWNHDVEHLKGVEISKENITEDVKYFYEKN